VTVGGATKKKKVVETDALGNVIESRPAAPKPVQKPVAPIQPAKPSAALGMLGGYAAAAPKDDPYEAFLRDINKA
jgi:hypothetical protein